MTRPATMLDALDEAPLTRRFYLLAAAVMVGAVLDLFDFFLIGTCDQRDHARPDDAANTAHRPREAHPVRFIQTLTNEWAYGRIYGSSSERTSTLPLYLDHYNSRRPHGSLGHQPPATRVNNLLGNYS